MRAVLIASLATASLLAGCASAAEGDAKGFPSLQEVPRDNVANTDAEYWAEVQAQLTAIGREVRANPRAQYPEQVEDPQAFLEAAQRELEETRQSHEPN